MSQIFTIQDDKVVIRKLSLETLEGDLTIAGTLTVDSITVLNDTENKQVDVGNWVVHDEQDIYGKGLSWTWSGGSIQLAYRPGGRLWSSSDIDLAPNHSFMIDNEAVLSKGELGGQITKSNLRELGTLKKLVVSGETALADFAYFNSTFGRLGLNTDSPNGTLSVVNNNVEVIISSDRDNVAQVGTYTSHSLEIVTDNIARVTLKNNGEVVFGNETTKNADVKIYGTLTVDTVVSDNRVDRYSPLEFKSSRDQSIYGQGLMWTGTGDTRQFIMRAGPDRLWSTDSLDLAENQSYHVNGMPVLSAFALGNTVTQSNLSKLGTLENLNVEGEATFLSHINASRAVINATNILFNNGDEFRITNSLIESNRKLSLKVSGDETYYADLNEIVIGNKQNIRRPVKVFGPLTVGVNNPNENVDLAVKGNISFANKTFVTGTTIPSSGSFVKGDICWNENPTADNYIGWVCIESGAPGRWLPFGGINRQ
jgi:hypothetical protein